MHLIYLDEAGNTGAYADPDQPVHMIGSLIVDQSAIKSFEEKLAALASDFVSSHPDRILISPDELEFHGAPIYGGKDIFRGVSPESRIELCEAIVDACNRDGVTFGHCSVDKMKLIEGHPHMKCFQFTLERVQDFLIVKHDLGLIVADEHRELEERLIRDLAQSKAGSTGWGWRPTKIDNIVDTVHFVKSKHNRIIQACDVLTYISLKALLINRRALESFKHIPGRPYTTAYSAHKASTLKRAELKVLELGEKIQTITRFTKLWPV